MYENEVEMKINASSVTKSVLLSVYFWLSNLWHARFVLMFICVTFLLKFFFARYIIQDKKICLQRNFRISALYNYLHF